jgi:hypothetical protein
MAAGQGFKTFVTGDVLTSGDVNGYLMQGINVFATTTARDAAITAPAEGQFAFTKDTNSLWYYDGAAWVASGATGDIEGVTAGIGISGGGTSGTVTVTNSMATEIDAKGDLIGGTGADTFARLAVGANGTVLTADSVETTGLKWATPTASLANFSLINSGGTALTGSATVTVSGISGYSTLMILIDGASSASADSGIRLRVNGASTNYFMMQSEFDFKSTYSANNFGPNQITSGIKLADMSSNAASEIRGGAFIFGCNSAGIKTIISNGAGSAAGGSSQSIYNGIGYYDSASTISSVSAFSDTGDFDAGTMYIYGSAV